MQVGVLGGGQLGRMLALAGYPLGVRMRLYDTPAESPAQHVAEYRRGPFDRTAEIVEFLRGVDVVTYEFENIPVATVEALEQAGLTVMPPPRALAVSQDRLAEKTLFQSLGIPTPDFSVVRSAQELADRAARTAQILKTRSGGYDGKGQAEVTAAQDAESAWAMLSSMPPAPGCPGLICESRIDFERELSTIAVRGRDGRTAFYPLIENRHERGILRESIAPAETSDALQLQSQEYASRVLDRLNYVGVLTIEWFERGGELLANEIAPRVHNSGHWTIEGAAASQFESHLRAILGLPLGDCAAQGHSRMFNLIGVTPSLPALLAIPGAHVHLYGKSARAGRKLGHVTAWGANRSEAEARGQQVARVIRDAASGN
ncbi:MAG: 5-(carboxyamino)imidazole ribonucleotide synthase [Phycisphaerales bacterium]|nr:5-(carboxyamino)imidazole ribonucleotide synthase [Phycisphaerales bacterium]